MSGGLQIFLGTITLQLPRWLPRRRLSLWLSMQVITQLREIYPLLTSFSPSDSCLSSSGHGVGMNEDTHVCTMFLCVSVHKQFHDENVCHILARIDQM